MRKLESIIPVCEAIKRSSMSNDTCNFILLLHFIVLSSQDLPTTSLPTICIAYDYTAMWAWSSDPCIGGGLANSSSASSMVP